jgi:hypothetical protein
MELEESPVVQQLQVQLFLSDVAYVAIPGLSDDGRPRCARYNIDD